MILKLFGYKENIPHEKEIILARRHFLEAIKETMKTGYTDENISILFQQQMFPLYKLEEYIEAIYKDIKNKGLNLDKVFYSTQNQPEEDDEKEIRMAVAHMLKVLDNEYKKIKVDRGGLDSNDLLKITANLLKKKSNVEMVGQYFKNRYKYLFVDEVQDTDKLQEVIISKLTYYLEGSLVVGDIKQSIYGFRGAEPTILENISNKFGTDILTIRVSRRPSKPLHEVQNILFDGMSDRYTFLSSVTGLPKNPRIPSDDLVPFEFITAEDNEIETRIRISINYVQSLLNEKINLKDEGEELRKVDYGDISLLFRTNKAMNCFAEAFKEASIPIEINSSDDFFKRPEIKHCFHMLQAILRYPNDLSLYLVIGTPFLPIQSELPLIAYDHNVDYLSAWLSENPETKKWFKGMMEVRKKAKRELVPKLLTEIYEFTKVREWYAKRGNSQAVANLEKLISWAREQMHSEALTLQQFVDRLRIAVLTDEKLDMAKTEIKEKGNSNTVTFSTIHSAKGLEYPILILPEISKPLFSENNHPRFFVDSKWGLDISLPDGRGRSKNFDDSLNNYRQTLFEEEARILYVAITRAENKVCCISNNIGLNTEDSDFWSWKDEILRVKTSLEQLGPGMIRFF